MLYILNPTIRIESKIGIILVIVITLMTALIFAPIQIYSANDISQHWAKGEIESWINEGYISGYPDGTFKPNNYITRAEFITIFNNVLGLSSKVEISFNDVDRSAWYRDEIAKAVASGYITGYPGNIVKPDQFIKRQEVAVIIARMIDSQPDLNVIESYEKKEAFEDWSKNQISVIISKGIMKGYNDGTFGGNLDITRAESVVTLRNFKTYKENKKLQSSYTSESTNISTNNTSTNRKISNGGSNNTEVIPTPTASPTPLIEATPTVAPNITFEYNSVPLKELNSSGSDGALIIGKGTGAFDVTLVVWDFSTVEQKFLGLTKNDLVLGKKKLCVNFDDKEYIFEYNNETEDLQVAFVTEKVITEAKAGNLLIGVK